MRTSERQCVRVRVMWKAMVLFLRAINMDIQRIAWCICDNFADRPPDGTPSIQRNITFYSGSLSFLLFDSPNEQIKYIYFIILIK